ncbi:MAG: hypothetical protein WKF96_01105 [Solirubrobacteraceae bacterium]
MPRIGIYIDVDDIRRFSVKAFSAPLDHAIGVTALVGRLIEDRDDELQCVRLYGADRSSWGKGDPWLRLDARIWREEVPGSWCGVKATAQQSAAVPIALALDATMDVTERRCDTAIIVGHDADLAPAVATIRGIGTGVGACETAGWSGVAIRGKDKGVHRTLDADDFAAIVNAGRAARLRSVFPNSGHRSDSPATPTTIVTAHRHPASVRGVFVGGTQASRRFAVFVDYRDLIDGSLRAFPDSEEGPLELSPLRLAERIVAREQGGELSLVVVSDARPSRERDRDGHTAVGARAERWTREDERVRAHLRPLQVIDGRPAPKGIGTTLALEAALALRGGRCDVAVLASADATLRSAVELLQVRFGRGAIKVASWWSPTHRRKIPQPAGAWHHRLDETDWQAALVRP